MQPTAATPFWQTAVGAVSNPSRAKRMVIGIRESIYCVERADIVWWWAFVEEAGCSPN